MGKNRYLTFKTDKAGSQFYARINQTSPTEFPNIYYSLDKVTWTKLVHTARDSEKITFDDEIYVYGDNPNGWGNTRWKCSLIVSGGKCTLKGNIMCLLNTDCDDLVEIPCDRCFGNVFAALSTSATDGWLVDASELILPATILKPETYGNGFINQRNLVKAPVLPAKTLVSKCYEGMFASNPSLKEVKYFANVAPQEAYCANWVYSPSWASNGTFHKNGYASWSRPSSSYLPSSWSIVDYTFSAEQRSYTLKGEGGSVEIPVKSVSRYTITADDWVNLEETFGEAGDSVVRFTYGITDKTRTGTITLTAPEGVIDIHITQKAAITTPNVPLFRNGNLIKKMFRSGELIYRRLSLKPSLTLSTDKVHFGKGGDVNTVAVSTDGKVSIDAPDWISSDYSEGVLTLTAPATTEKREGVITITSTNVDGNTVAEIQAEQIVMSAVVDLNNNWIESGTTTEGYKIYASNSNYHVAGANAICYVDIEGYTEFTLMVKTYGESGWDYLVVSQLDKTPIRKSETSANDNIWTGYRKSSTTWFEVKFTNIDGGAHRITLLYGKDSSGDSFDDRGYFYIPE